MNLLLVDGYTIFREGLKTLLKAGYPQPLSVIEAASAATARQCLSRKRIDLILLALQLDETTGIDSLVHIKRYAGHCPIVVLSAGDDQNTRHQCMNSGAVACLSKRSSVQDLLSAIQAVMTNSGRSPLNCAASTHCARSQHDDSILAHLSKRQREVLDLLLQGKPNKSISTHMDISQNTVKAHLSAIFKILGARNRTEAVYFAARAGLPLE